MGPSYSGGEIGAAIIARGSVVMSDVRQYAIVLGNPPCIGGALCADVIRDMKNLALGAKAGRARSKGAAVAKLLIAIAEAHVLAGRLDAQPRHVVATPEGDMWELRGAQRRAPHRRRHCRSGANTIIRGFAPELPRSTCRTRDR